MGAKPSKRGSSSRINSDPHPGIKRQRNYVQLCSPPPYNLYYDTTDSEITELEEEFEPPRKITPKPSFKRNTPPPLSIPTLPPESYETSVVSVTPSPPPLPPPPPPPIISTGSVPIRSAIKSPTITLSPIYSPQPPPPLVPLSPISELPSANVSTLASNTSISSGYLRTSTSLIQARSSPSSPVCIKGETRCIKSLRIKSVGSGTSICTRQKCEARGMPDYQRYSREQPEREAAANPPRDCCRPSCSKNLCKRDPTPPRVTNTSKSTHTHSPSRSRHSSTNQAQRSSSRRAISQQTSDPPGNKSQRQSAPSPNRYPHYPERPHIPLPPRCNRNTCNSVDCKNKRKNNHNLYHERETPEHRTSSGDMYSHNTKRNFATKKPYSPTNTGRANSPYEGTGHELNCAHHEQCPMHRTCKCKCRCSEGDTCCQGHGHHGHARQPSPSPPRNMGNECRGQCHEHNHPSDEEMSYYSDSSNSDLNLAYQRTGDYPELMDELENTLSYRNRLRVQKTMQRFEMLSRQNKSLEKPIFEDEDPGSRQYKQEPGSGPGCDCDCPTCDKRRQCGMGGCQTRAEALAKRPTLQPTPFPRNSGYVEKVARYMEPANNSDTSKGSSSRKTSDGCSWQMDPRKNEWVKVDPNHQHQHHHHHHHNHHHQGGDQPAHQDHYDFENSYPPLPPRPPRGYGSSGVGSNSETGGGGACSCGKCCRRPH